jgi:quercetin dioxygenase-like cupin family protein
MRINPGREASLPSQQRSDTFTGEVWADPVLESTGEVMINSVFFGPRSRTYWHTHERGQILYVTSGQGRIFSRGGEGGIIRAGDTVWILPGEEHWHGADAETYLVHLAISLGKSEWLDEVSEADYERGAG